MSKEKNKDVKMDEPDFAKASPDAEEQEEVVEAIEENIDYKEAWIRVTADYQNIKKEMAAKQSEYAQYANQRLLEQLIPVIEHFHQGLKYIPEKHAKADWMIGFKQIQKQLNEFMAINGLVRMKTVGEKFDPKIHEAVTNRKDDKAESGIIIEEMMGGYKLKGKLIIPARVIVAE